MKIESLTPMMGAGVVDGQLVPGRSAAIIPLRKSPDAVDLLQVVMRLVYAPEEIGKNYHIGGTAQPRGGGNACGVGNTTFVTGGKPGKPEYATNLIMIVPVHFDLAGLYEVIVTLRDVSVPDGDILGRHHVPFRVVEEPSTD